MWFMSLDMASGFWAVTMTERAKLISAFVCPFGHFQCGRMLFGLKNAPLIYQAVINNCVWGFARLPPEEEKLVDPDVLGFLGMGVNKRCESEREKSGSKITVLTDAMTAFQMEPVLGRSSAEGLRATPKIAKGVQNLPFPKTLKRVQSFLGSLNYYHTLIEDFPFVAAVLYELTDEQVRSGRDLSRAKEAFEILKRKIVSTPLLRHPDRTKSYAIIPRGNKWAACAVLGQEYDGVIQPVRFTGHVLNDSEVQYQIAEKEVVAIMRVLEVFGTIVENFHIVDGLAAILGAGITPHEHLDEVAEALIPAKGRVKPPPVISVEMLDDSYTGYVLSFDGAAKTSTHQGSCGCVVWELHGWYSLRAHSFILEDVTVNDAEYHGLLKGMELMSERNVQDLVVVGDSRIAIQQVQDLINCNQSNLQ
ncbi:unnamed protein product [Phytophthora fragariaefolia]|uniref:Unnamed protein product n=1 Tax=Phytophthora fragariaefolia TaxID=1490495 RepID=A0A9W6XSY0_9STRA|nr:unnamed protein product [Phytophthora fragariaefolia]